MVLALLPAFQLAGGAKANSDTHVVLWWLADDPERPEIKDRLDHEPDARVSAATIWEIAIKQALGEISAPAHLPERVRDSGFRELSVCFAHAIAAGRLPPSGCRPAPRTGGGQTPGPFGCVPLSGAICSC